MLAAKSSSPGKSKHLVGPVFIVLIWLFLLYGRFLHQLTPETYRPLWSFTGPLVWLAGFLNPIFSSPYGAILGYGLGMGFVIWGTVKFWQHKKWRTVFIVCGLLGSLFPFVMPAMYGEYQLPVTERQGYELTWVTEPGTSVGSAYKQAQLMHEAECDYHLSGWATETALAYTSACWPGTWLYDTHSGSNEWVLSGNETADFASSSVTRWNNVDYLGQPVSLQASGQFPFLTLEKSRSPDGQWEAVVVRWFYGPSDIVLVERTTE